MSIELDFDALQKERQELTDFLSQPDAYADKNFAAKNRRLTEVDELIKLGKQREQLQNDIKEAENDPELAVMKPDFEQELAEVEAKLTEMLIPKDPNDDKAAIIEIRAGAGGDEASLFAGDLYRMYIRYAETHGLKTELQSESINDAGGYKEVIFRVSGDRAYGKLKFEGGVHRVQRVPATEIFRRPKRKISKLSQKIFVLIFTVPADTAGRALILLTLPCALRIYQPAWWLLCKTSAANSKIASRL